jgi:hypothetical protein
MPSAFPTSRTDTLLSSQALERLLASITGPPEDATKAFEEHFPSIRVYLTLYSQDLWCVLLPPFLRLPISSLTLVFLQALLCHGPSLPRHHRPLHNLRPSPPQLCRPPSRRRSTRRSVGTRHDPWMHSGAILEDGETGGEYGVFGAAGEYAFGRLDFDLEGLCWCVRFLFTSSLSPSAFSFPPSNFFLFIPLSTFFLSPPFSSP